MVAIKSLLKFGRLYDNKEFGNIKSIMSIDQNVGTWMLQKDLQLGVNSFRFR